METNEKVGLMLILFVIGIFVCVVGFDQVDASHLGVMNEFGVIKGVMHPGLKWTGLFTFVEQYDMRIRKVTVTMEGLNGAPDKGGQSVYAQIDVNFKLKPEGVETIYSKVGLDKEVVENLLIVPIMTEGFKRATNKYDALEIINNREEVAHLTEKNIRERFPTQYFDIETVVVSNIHYTPDFQKALDDKKTAAQLTQVAQQNLEKVKFEQDAEIERYKAEAEKARLQYQAEAEKLKMQKAEITPMMLQSQWIAKWDGSLPSYLITTSETTGNILNLPSGVSSAVKQGVTP